MYMYVVAPRHTHQRWLIFRACHSELECDLAPITSHMRSIQFDSIVRARPHLNLHALWPSLNNFHSDIYIGSTFQYFWGTYIVSYTVDV